VAPASWLNQNDSMSDTGRFSFPSPEVAGAVIESVRNLCELNSDEFDDLGAYLERLQTAIEPLENLLDRQVLNQALGLSVILIRWASQETGLSEQSIIDIVSSHLTD
jgi:hypothetical protein